MDKKVKQNYIYNVLYQLLIIILPLITAPYLSRVIGPTSSGIFSYVYSYVYYFMIFSMLGINNYGNREVAKNRDNKENLSKVFSEIYFIQFLMTFISMLIYITFLIFIDYEFKTIAWIQSIFLISVLFDVNWFFQGLEEFKIIVLRNAFIKIITFIFILLLVKSPNDLWIYTCIMSISTVISQLLIWPFLFKKVTFQKFNLKKSLKHLKKIMILFIPIIAISIYQIMDKIMLGLISNVTEVGYYEYAEKIVAVPLSLMIALGTVMMPRMSNLLSNGKKEECEKYIEITMKFQMFLAFALTFGIIAISDLFIPIYLGNNFINCSAITIVLVCYLPFTAWQTVLRTLFLIPSGMDKQYILSTIGGAIANLITNIIFIPRFGGIGAALGTVIAEFVAMLIITYSLRKELPIKKYFYEILPFFGKALIMFVLVYIIRYTSINIIYKLCVQIFLGILAYYVLNIKYIKNVIKNK